MKCLSFSARGKSWKRLTYLSNETFHIAEKAWTDVSHGMRPLLCYCWSTMAWWERKPQPSKPYHREENNDPPVLSTDRSAATDGQSFYLLFGYSRAIISKLIMIWWTKNFTDGTQTTALPWVCFLGSWEIHHLPVIWIILETFKGIRIMRKKIKTRPRVANMLS